ncbi:MAG: mannitol dehydrogenase family protein [Novosphingobium sp.]|nr:mannitol dehydrogenase family protein [Novosphingobium sp.]
MDAIPPGIPRFAYDRAAQAIGIVHFGIGAFHRAHQAWYTDRAMDAGDRDWMIAGVSLRSAEVAGQMNPQDGLYSVTERSAAGDAMRIVGAVREVLVAPRSRASIAISLITPTTHIVSLTITEKGYCRAPDGSLDFDRVGEGSIYPILTDAMQQRRAAGISGLTLLSCDNLADNGHQLARLMSEYLDRHEPSLRAWFEAECACPATMVDRIVPATTDEDRAAVAAPLGVRDEAAVVTEPFSQWVIEDRFAGPRPAWEKVGAQLVGDVAPYETAKLRMLNGAHSALAYLGLERGHTYVHQAIADPALRPLIERLMKQEAAASFTPAPGQDLDAYADALLARFANPALNHRLAQIAMDGSQKIPQRWLATLAAMRATGRPRPAILAALAAWVRHVRGDGHPVDDPMADRLRAAWDGQDFAGAVRALFARGGVMAGEWAPDEGEIETMAVPH